MSLQPDSESTPLLAGSDSTKLWGAVEPSQLPKRQSTKDRPRSTPDRFDETSVLATSNTSIQTIQRSGSVESLRQPYLPNQAARRASRTHDDQYQRYRYYNRIAPASNPNPLIMPHHVVPPPVFVVGGASKKGEQSSIVTILSIWNTMMGTSVLAMPWCIQQAGLGLGIGLMLVVAALAFYTASIVLDSGNGGRLNGKDVEFADVVEYYLGKKWYIVAVIFSILTLAGASMVYWVLMSSFLFTVGDYFHSPHHNGTNATSQLFETAVASVGALTGSPDPSCPNSTTLYTTVDNVAASDTWSKVWNLKTVPLFLIVLLFPLLNFKSLTFFTKFNSLGILSIIYIIFFVVFAASSDYTVSPVGGIHTNDINWASSKFPSLTGVLSLAFFIHNGCLSIMRNQRRPDKNKRDLSLAFIFVLLTYMVVGMLFFLAYRCDRDSIASNFLQNFTKKDGNFIFALVAQIFLFIQMTTVYPLLQYIVRFQVMTTLYDDPYPSVLKVILLNGAMTVVCVLVAVFYPEIGSILRYTGALCGLVYIFLLPALVHTKMLQQKGLHTCANTSTSTHSQAHTRSLPLQVTASRCFDTIRLVQAVVLSLITFTVRVSTYGLCVCVFNCFCFFNWLICDLFACNVGQLTTGYKIINITLVLIGVANLVAQFVV
eukprot:m.6332 g.6332  ORF g.6332 m.6332 type:complete len:656 (+) comp5145_c0_seq2:331-2298(+)